MLKKMYSIVLTAILAISLFSCAGYKTDGLDGYKNYKTQVFATGIELYASLLGGDEDAAFAEMKALMTDINADMSLSLSTSALTAFNNSTEAGFSVEVQKFTYDIMVKSQQIYADTDGAFNIAVNDISKLWNVDTAGLNKYGGILNDTPAPLPPKYEDVLATKNNCDLNNLKCYIKDEKYYIQKTTANLKLDLGAIAKGYSADACISIAKKHGVESGFINISGNVCLLGRWYNPELKQFVNWNIGVTNPRERGGMSGNVCALKLPEPYSIVTSGDFQRFYDYIEVPVDEPTDKVPTDKSKGARAKDENKITPLYVCHIINPQTGMPINIQYDEATKKYSNTADGVISAVIITQNSAEADAYATAVCVLGYEKGVQLMQKLGLKGIVFTEDKKMALVGISEDENKEGITLIQTIYPPIDGYKQYTRTEYK